MPQTGCQRTFFFGNLEFSKIWTESQTLAEDYADSLNVLALKERSKTWNSTH